MMAAATFFRLSINLVHFFLILLLTAELTSQRKDMQSRDLLNRVYSIQSSQELCKPVISVHKTSKRKHTSMMSSTNLEKFRRIVGLTWKLILMHCSCVMMLLQILGLQKYAVLCVSNLSRKIKFLRVARSVMLISISNALAQSLNWTRLVAYVRYLKSLSRTLKIFNKKKQYLFVNWRILLVFEV